MKTYIERLKELTETLNEASKAYYKENREIMSNFEYDKLYDELVELERKTNITLSNSPTINVGYEILESLPKEKHESRMLSLDKTKDMDELIEWIGNNQGVLSYKIDGITLVLTYEDGKLIKAVTRGNGEIGEVVTENAKVFKDVPITIPQKNSLTIRGEAYISYSDFEKINANMEDDKYKNPRNLCSGSVRQLNPQVAKERNISFAAFSVLKEEGETRSGDLKSLSDLGFKTVPFEKVSESNLKEMVKTFTDNARTSDIPTDGLVLAFDNIEYGKSLGVTSKFPRDSIAYKWEDETAITTLINIEWSPSRTGLINPVGIFEPVELEDTTISRASVHNISILKELNLVTGDQIEVYKANMIIPQISRNLKEKVEAVEDIYIPKKCPVCSRETIIKNENSVETLICPNPICPAKRIKEFVHFSSRDAMNIEGISEATIEKLIETKVLEKISDIFYLKNYEKEISSMEGFGKKSFENMIDAIKKAQKTEPHRLLYGLGIGGIGLANAKLIVRKWEGNWEEIENATFESLVEINGIGPVMAENFVEYFAKEENKKEVKKIRENVEFVYENIGEGNQIFENKKFVITGSLYNFANRKDLQAVIEKHGGQVVGSVSKNTDFLINNDKSSKSSKNKSAMELNVKIIKEEEFLEMISKENL